jgi:serine O-acetyltransferase
LHNYSTLQKALAKLALPIVVVNDLIESKADYEFFLEADRIALDIPAGSRIWCGRLLTVPELRRPRLFREEAYWGIWRFQRLLRKVEFLQNCGTSQLRRISYLRPWNSLGKLSVKLGFTIPPNVFGPGLSIAHRGTIVVHPDSKIGENCRIYHSVTIGSGRLAPNDSPSIGNNVFIGVGAVIVGAIKIADGIAIGANSYVNRSFSEPNITIAGCPAKKISNKGSEDLWIRATEILRKSSGKKVYRPDLQSLINAHDANRSKQTLFSRT